MKKTEEEKFIQARDIRVCYHDAGDHLTPLIFIHGFPFDKSMWIPQFDFFKSFRRVIAMDLRGFGKTDAGKDSFSMALFAEDLVHLMDALQIDRAVVCGLSMGGYILLNAYSRYRERFAGIVLSDTQCIADSSEGKEKRHKTISMIEEKGLSEFAAGFVKNIFAEESYRQKKELVDRIEQTILTTSPQTIMKTLKALAERAETCSVLETISVPALVICGNEDRVTPPVQSEFLSAQIIHSDLHILEGAGHMSNLEQAALFNSLLKSFLESKEL